MIRNYENPENTISLIDSTSVTVPVKVFTSSTTGGPLGGAVIGQVTAVTTIAFCNTAAPSTADETTNSVTVNIYLVRSGKSFVPGNLIVSNLTVPAGETVFFNDERIILNSADEIWVGTSADARLAVTVSALPV
jgi:hypothetical protein